MLRALFYKDYRLFIGNQVAELIIQHLFILVVISINLGVLGYSVYAVGGGWAFLMNVLIKEKNSSGKKMLYAASYQPWQLVVMHYITAFFHFFGLTGIYIAFSLVTNAVGISIFKMLTLPVFINTFLSYCFFIAITLPLYFILEDVMVQGISAILIIGSVFLAMGIATVMGEVKVNQFLKFWNEYGNQATGILCIVVIVISMTFVIKREKSLEG